MFVVSQQSDAISEPFSRNHLLLSTPATQVLRPCCCVMKEKLSTTRDLKRFGFIFHGKMFVI